MSQLLDLLQAVKDKNLSKEALEEYHTDLTNLYVSICVEMADREKEEAVFFLKNKGSIQTDKGIKDRSDVEIKRMWRGTESGQRLIELKAYDKAVTKVLSSIKNRIYSLL